MHLNITLHMILLNKIAFKNTDFLYLFILINYLLMLFKNHHNNLNYRHFLKLIKLIDVK
jgi:hypothetical protein